MAKQQTLAGEFCREGTARRLAQRISTSLHRENARATLRRLWQSGSAAPPVFDLAAADSDEEEDLEGGSEVRSGADGSGVPRWLQAGAGLAAGDTVRVSYQGVGGVIPRFATSGMVGGA